MVSTEQILEALDAIVEGGELVNHFQATPTAWGYCAERFEAKTGLNGLSQSYKMPDGLSAPEVLRPAWKQEVISQAVEGGIRICKDLPDFSQEAVTEHYEALKTDFDARKKTYDMLSDTDHTNQESSDLHNLKHHALPQAFALASLFETFKDIKPEDLQAAAAIQESRVQVEYEKIYRKLEALNPELEVLGVKAENASQLFHATWGVLSHYNVTDIKFCLESGDAWWRDNKQLADRYDKVVERTGVVPNWVPSPSTLLKIEQQLDRREAREQSASR